MGIHEILSFIFKFLTILVVTKEIILKLLAEPDLQLENRLKIRI
jgi:hypothetical protein